MIKPFCFLVHQPLVKINDCFISVFGKANCCDICNNPATSFHKGEEKESSECQFKIHKDKQKGIVRLESVKMPGVFLGIGETGRISHAVDAGDLTASFLVEVASCMSIKSIFRNYDMFVQIIPIVFQFQQIQSTPIDCMHHFIIRFWFA